jgi:molybdopterin converting factor small subunit
MPRIELLGLAQHFAGVSQLDSAGTTLEQVLQDIGQHSPSFAARCPAGALLPTSLIVCVNERRFTSELTERIEPTDRIIILSADVGG